MTNIDPFLDAVDQAEQLRSGELSPSEAVEAAIGRIEKSDSDAPRVIYG